MRRPVDLSTYLVADLATLDHRDAADVVRAAVDGGATIVQVRGKDVGATRLLEVVIACAEANAGRATLVVNDRIDVYLAARAAGADVHGVHIGQSDVPPVSARQIVGPDAIIGLSASTPENLDRVRALPPGTVDYLGTGAVRATPTKRDHPVPLGWDGLARAIASAGGLPCVAIGGLGPGDAADAYAAGADGVAVVRAICLADDPAGAARELRREWSRVSAPVPNILAIAGSDPSGGAGIQADLKTIQATGGYGMAAITALTAQNTQGVSGVHVPPLSFLRAQLDAIASDVTIDAIKIGMLGTADVIQTVTTWLDGLGTIPAVVLDPVMVATSGDRLLDDESERALFALIDRADVVTPNLVELAALTGGDVAQTWDEALTQARALAARHAVLVLAKGGHLRGSACPDALVGTDGPIIQMDGPRIVTENTHGTGCSLSSALASLQARTGDWAWSTRLARDWLRGAITAADTLAVGGPGGHGPLDHAHAIRTGARPPRLAAEPDFWWEQIAQIRADIDAGDFVRQLAQGTLPAERFDHYLQQDALYLQAYARVLRSAADLAPTREERDFWAASAEGCLVAEMELHRSRGADARAEESAETAAYLRHLRDAAEASDYALLVAAVLPCFWIYDDLGRRLAAASSEGHPYADWLATYGDPAFTRATQQAIEVARRAARRESDAGLARMMSAFTRSSELEKDFFAQRPRVLVSR
ncbi:bifunctional hydroxymethylpyrimidine kinase/phosphomethylpyrimidine kinase [Microbacterium amylolyticum]|uniref:Thiamine-phosphate synthase n=1 Tax=Microbacterium amylolyticum TaxID=936337 RepID=A0ABS4ZKA7_9MICO|nr:bifunctional hydroxymethylpyrimidine kinase/phosphomethylpyrimidine kinase [Microbacterium amylolyticum]MBP2437728.1 hydroxymethylpyrimidine kinase/phosphomethylpyrimidine kinase/thiamine-phosphate diphosphorylase [Microbacterium amylolyticum]